jgi:UPF0716 protein FxsA
MLRWLLFAFTIVPIIELFLLIQVGQWIGVWPTVGIILVTGVVGAFLAKAQGLFAVAQLKGAVVQGRLPGRELLNAALVVIGGSMLVTPGVVTDVVGILLLLPPTRALVAVGVGAWLKRRIHVQVGGFEAGWPGQGFPGPRPGRPGEDVVEGEFRRSDAVGDAEPTNEDAEAARDERDARAERTDPEERAKPRPPSPRG